MIEPSSLPRELIPVAWTSSPQTNPFFRTQNLDSHLDESERQARPQTSDKSLSTKSENGFQFPNSQEMQSGDILMGIMHSSRPHYGLQVNCYPNYNFL